MDVNEELKFFFWGGGGVRLLGEVQCGCEQRIEVIVEGEGQYLNPKYSTSRRPIYVKYPFV